MIIPREYFKKFIEACKRNLDENYKLIAPTDYKYGIGKEIYKIVNTKTIIKRHNDDAENIMGVFIDVFPLDYSDNDWGLFLEVDLLKS